MPLIKVQDVTIPAVISVRVVSNAGFGMANYFLPFHDFSLLVRFNFVTANKRNLCCLLVFLLRSG